jgi:cold shock CspA family protein
VASAKVHLVLNESDKATADDLGKKGMDVWLIRDSDVIRTGEISHLYVDRGYGFLVAKDGQRFFFSYKDMADDLPLTDLNENDEVTFELGSNAQGITATNVRRIDLKDLDTKERTGSISTVGKTFGFLQPDDSPVGENLFFSPADIDPSSGLSFATLKQGQEVRFRLGKNRQGIKATSIRPI